MRFRRGEAGFTLIELLVTLALLGMLGLLLHAGIRDGARVWRTVEARSDGVERVALTQNFLRDRIASVAARPDSEPVAEAGRARFDGAPDRLSITAPWLATLPAAGLYRLEFAAARAADGAGGLIVRWAPAATDIDAGATAGWGAIGERELLERIRRVRFSYFGALEDRGEKTWHADWASEIRPPELVRIEVEFDDPARIWPTLTIAIP